MVKQVFSQALLTGILFLISSLPAMKAATPILLTNNPNLNVEVSSEKETGGIDMSINIGKAIGLNCKYLRYLLEKAHRQCYLLSKPATFNRCNPITYQRN